MTSKSISWRATLAFPVGCLSVAAFLWTMGWNQPLFITLHDALLQWGGALWANFTVLGDSALTPCYWLFLFAVAPICCGLR